MSCSSKSSCWSFLVQGTRKNANRFVVISWIKFFRSFHLCFVSILEGSQYTRVKEGLRINRVEMFDNDTFSCRADVLETGESQDYPITVIISSKFWIENEWMIHIAIVESVTAPRITCATPCAIEKKTATLVCESSGLPPPKYAWYYGSVSKSSSIDFLGTIFIEVEKKEHDWTIR